MFERRVFRCDEERFNLPIFMGHDPEGWIFEMERYFWIFRLTEEEVDLAIDCFEEFAMDWYQWEIRAPFYSWRELKSTLLDRFSYAKNGIHYNKLPIWYRERYAEYYMLKYCPHIINKADQTTCNSAKEKNNKVNEKKIEAWENGKKAYVEAEFKAIEEELKAKNGENVQKIVLEEPKLNPLAQLLGTQTLIDLDADFNSDLSLTNSKIEDNAEAHLDVKIRNENILCDRHKISGLSAPFRDMPNGCFTEPLCDVIDLSENNLSPLTMKGVWDFSLTESSNEVSPDFLLGIVVFANKFCCEELKDACDKKIVSAVSSRDNAVELKDYAFEENCPILSALCLQVFFNDLPSCLNDNRIVEIFRQATRQQRSILVGIASVSLYCLLREVSMYLDPRYETTSYFLEHLTEVSETDQQRLLVSHHLGCVRFLRKEYDEAEFHFEDAFKLGHIYSIAGLARLDHNEDNKLGAYEHMNSVISSAAPLGWIYQEIALHCEGNSYVFDRGKYKTQIPLFNLEDKVDFRAGGNVTLILRWKKGIG